MADNTHTHCSAIASALASRRTFRLRYRYHYTVLPDLFRCHSRRVPIASPLTAPSLTAPFRSRHSVPILSRTQTASFRSRRSVPALSVSIRPGSFRVASCPECLRRSPLCPRQKRQDKMSDPMSSIPLAPPALAGSHGGAHHTPTATAVPHSQCSTDTHP